MGGFDAAALLLCEKYCAPPAMVLLTKQPSIHTEAQPAPYKQASDSVHVANEQAEEGRETLHMF